MSFLVRKGCDLRKVSSAFATKQYAQARLLFVYEGNARYNSPIRGITSISFVVENSLAPFHSAWAAVSSRVTAALLRKSFLSVFVSVAAK